MKEWWKCGAGFFGRHYIIGDNSLCGYIPGKPETLEERTEREIKGVIGLLSLTPLSKILDIPCGYGRHSISLAKKGYNVTGIDINLEFLQSARSAAETDGVSVGFSNGDMRCLEDRFYSEFDAVINMFFSFGFFGKNENIRTMQEFFKSLRPGGQLLIHTDVCPEIINGGNYRLTETRELVKGGKLLINEAYDHQTGRINGKWTIVNCQGIDHQLTPYSVRIYSTDELEKMARLCGFGKTRFYGSFQKNKFSPDSKELIFIAEK